MAHDLEIAWDPGRDLVSGEDILVPAALVYLNYFRGGNAAEPRTNFQACAGITAGETLEQGRTFCAGGAVRARRHDDLVGERGARGRP